MKLFFKEHFLLILLQIFQLTLIVLIYWLDGYENLLTALYSVFIGLCILSVYLIYRYVSHKSFYRRLTKPLDTLDESIKKTGYSPLSEALDELLQGQYRHYQEQLKAWERNRNEHMTFMNQWVHQMKTPLSVIELIVQDEDDPRFTSIREEVDRVHKGLETVLYAARLGAFEHDFQVEQVSLLSIVDKVIHENKRLFIRSFVYPEVKVEEGLNVETDAKWLTFVLSQIVINAIKYSEGSNKKITVSSGVKDKEVILEVQDLGVGIPAADLRRVFEPFYTGENGRKFRESTGMGLYLVKEVCEHLGHLIELESEVGVGTTVRLKFSSYVRNV
ncbi:sensor histidine kinase [Pseudalkalibacillus decolorationis]|uniref:sensor histidine kinase n=1 Tax=Pseudalkalibacillus decolorationis TaxID=163879 RepID=UPI00214868FF|nr:sensor histidine kinase [Pseudalkalibacillus decolorationis]